MVISIRPIRHAIIPVLDPRPFRNSSSEKSLRYRATYELRETVLKGSDRGPQPEGHSAPSHQIQLSGKSPRRLNTQTPLFLLKIQLRLSSVLPRSHPMGQYSLEY